MTARVEPTGKHTNGLLARSQTLSPSLTQVVDRNADETKILLRHHGAFAKMTPHLASSDKSFLQYTLAAIQNLCTELAYVRHMQETGIVGRLDELAGSGDPAIARYANGCLANMRESAIVAEVVLEAIERMTVYMSSRGYQIDPAAIVLFSNYIGPSQRVVEDLCGGLLYELGLPQVSFTPNARISFDQVRAVCHLEWADDPEWFAGALLSRPTREDWMPDWEPSAE